MIGYEDDRYEEAEYGDAEYEDAEDGAEATAPGRRRRAVRAGVAVVCGGMLAIGGVGAYNVAHAVWGGSGGGGAAKPAQQAAATAAQAPTTDQAATAAKGFLDAWGRGDVAAAAALTDRPDLATGALSSFRQELHPSEFTLTPTGATGATAAASAQPGRTAQGFHARMRFEGTDRAWEYDGRLGVVRTDEGRTAVHWEPGVIHPRLAEGGSIAVRTVDALPGRLVDRNGKPFDDSSPVKAMLAGVKTGGRPGTPGRAVVLVRGAAQPAEQLFTLTDPGAAEFRVTLDAALQRAVEAALREQTGGGRAGSVVAVEPSTGHVLAVASAPAGTFNRAFGGEIAPGSTMKVVTGAALLEAGLDPDSPAPCRDTVNSPKAWHNDERGDHLGYTLADDFAHSCNTAFIEQGLAKLGPGTLAKVAAEQFGLGLEWHTGLTSFDARIPAPGSRDEQAAEYIGQGSIQMNTLLMASVAATVQSGTFRQPVVVDGVADRATAPGRLPAAIARDLRAMMAKTVREGTARAPMAGLSGQVGAKTGTAEVDGRNPNSWFIAYRGDLAVAVEVEGAGHGAEAAGRAAAQILRVGNHG
ncbi:penicillin-binding transpeptidase domain-containing protein [Kitasatospora sp. DSM 101779]|uniref:penicillin-binding transpeptidase domain-containing protein n=1 Tax=Kitasatospora sp. DSM 101779 TaxID=2853165 RepID=UPI0021DB15B1|nr:penicillin-binding transpeptidase domain-containing protein [Kitasatospora sp. DSM 101779]MCU7820390.1 penicillin-binding protein [Kitasatospora sp. DSM 101779]